MNQQPEEKVPSKEEVIAFLKEQIEVKEFQLKLQELNTSLAKARFEELKSIAYMGQLTNSKQNTSEDNAQYYEGGIPHTITEEDMRSNPELAEQGLKVGDEVIIPKEDDVQKPVSSPSKTNEETKQRSLKKK